MRAERIEQAYREWVTRTAGGDSTAEHLAIFTLAAQHLAREGFGLSALIKPLFLAFGLDARHIDVTDEQSAEPLLRDADSPTVH